MHERFWSGKLLKSALLSVAATVVAYFFLLGGCTVGPSRMDNTNTAISLTRADGSRVEVPLSGPLHSHEAERIAREIQALDTAIASRKASAKTASEGAILAVVVESRNDAVHELDLALRVARNTSAGQLDTSILGKANRYSSVANEVLRSPVPNTSMVNTQILTSIPNATLHYQSKGEYDAKSELWLSYSEGDRLRIGLYVFLVEPPGPVTDSFCDLVPVTSDPTKKNLTPHQVGKLECSR